MAFALIDSITEETFTFTQRAVKTTEDMFAEGYRAKSFNDVQVGGKSKEDFAEAFFKNLPRSHKFLCDLVIDNRLVYSKEELETMQEARLLAEQIGEYGVVVVKAIDHISNKLSELDVYAFCDVIVVSVHNSDD